MAAIAYPSYESPRRSGQPDLRVVRPGTARRRRRPPAGVYHRRRLAVVALLVVLALAGVGLLSLVRAGAGVVAGPSSAGAPRSAAAAGSHVVEPGETYWSIAADLDRPGDVRSTVDALVEANGGRLLRAGDRVVVPAG